MGAVEVLAVVAAEVGKGALQYIGGAIAEQQLHDLGIIKKRDIVREVIIAVRQIVREEIRAALSEQELAQLQSHLSNAGKNLGLYIDLDRRQRRENRGLLVEVISDTGYVIERTRTYGILGGHVFAGAFGLRLVAFQASYKDSHDEGYYSSGIREIEENIPYLQAVIGEFRELNRPERRISAVTCERVERRSGPTGVDGPQPVDIFYICSFSAEGQTYSYRNDREDGARTTAEAGRHQALAALTEKHRKLDIEFSLPLEEAIAAWQEAAKLMQRQL